MRLRHITALAITALALTACTSTDQPAPAETITIQAPTPDPTPTLDDDMTQLVVDLSWEQQTEDDKDAMCQGIALYGPDWAAEQMQQGAGDSVVDWDRAAELVEQKCAAR
ncbi:hypothetical protein [Streptomyces griseorubiginosus]|uniref:hypothetical protein n=1 Tax=Streptomyces griseorubiginosus TaxID=67304 RepID=UPI0036E15FFB